MKRIPLTPLSEGLFAIVDDRDYDRLNRHRWKVGRGSDGRILNARRTVTNGTIAMHHEVIGYPLPGMEVDHKNRNPLDNRRMNLRFCTRVQNSANTGKRRSNTSGFKGVYLVSKASNKPGNKRWIAYLQVGKRRVSGGCFVTPEEAARKYDELAIRFNGPFAYLNFPNEHHH